MNDKTQKPRSQQEIFSDMHRDLRIWNPKIAESPERLDPVMKILLELYAHQLSDIDANVRKTWEITKNALIRSMAPGCKRWPVPSFTVMRCQTADAAVTIDPHTRFFYKEKRAGGQTLFFSSVRNEKLLAASVRNIYLRLDSQVYDLSPVTDESAPPKRAVPPGSDGAGELYVAVDYNGPPSELRDALAFMRGDNDALHQLRWGSWNPGAGQGGFYDDCAFCPGLSSDIDDLFHNGGGSIDWGGLRTSMDIFKPLENNFVALTEDFTATWESGPVSEKFAGILAENGLEDPSSEGSFYWIRVDLPPGGDRAALQRDLGMFLDAFVAVNRNELSLFKHTGGSRLIELELPEDLSTILDIVSVTDSSGRSYSPTHRIQDDPEHRYYSIEERGDHLVLWFDFSSFIDQPPDSLTVVYSVTASVGANGIEAGKITELYENHPGITESENLIPTGGAIPAKTEEQIRSEASARLRSRDRALSFAEIGNWARTFDPRIQTAACKNGVERAPRGVRRCVVVTIGVNGEEFVSEDETRLLQDRLGRFLKSRAPVNTQFRVEIDKK